jgi:hypothetical protein
VLKKEREVWECRKRTRQLEKVTKLRLGEGVVGESERMDGMVTLMAWEMVRRCEREK